MYKPEGYTSLSPYFVVSDAPRWVELLRGIFPIQELKHFYREDGSVLHGELLLDDTVIMFSQADDRYPVNELLVHVYVSNAVAVFDRAMELGCVPLEEPEKKEDPNIRGMFRDFSGHIWAVGTLLTEI